MGTVFARSGCGKQLHGLDDMRVRANNDIRAPVRNFLSQRTLGVGGSMTAFNTPVYTHNNDIRLLACKLDLLLDHILLAGINNIGGSIGRRGGGPFVVSV